MTTKLPFTFKYTKEMSESLNSLLKDSGKCSVQNPDFYGKWDMVKFGTSEYDVAFSKKRTKK